MLVNNEVGTIQPVAEYAAAAHAKGSLLLCDAVQGYGRMAIPEGPDLIAISAHKIHGPKGIGALWIRDGLRLPPFILGGGQEQNMRSGTVSPALVAGFGAAARLAAGRMETDAAHVARLWDVALRELAGWTINGSIEHRYPRQSQRSPRGGERGPPALRLPRGRLQPGQRLRQRLGQDQPRAARHGPRGAGDPCQHPPRLRAATRRRRSSALRSA